MSEVCPICEGSLSPGAAACPQCGFRLAGATQSFEPCALGGEELPCEETAKRPLAASLRVIRGPQIGTIFKLGDTSLSIGRSPHCDIFLNDMTVSRQHAVIAPDGSDYRIADTDSFNGVWLYNKSVDNAVLKDGDIIQIGAFCLLYRE